MVGLSVEAVSTQIGLPPKTIQAIEAGTVSIHLADLSAFARLYRRTPSHFLATSDDDWESVSVAEEIKRRVDELSLRDQKLLLGILTAMIDEADQQGPLASAGLSWAGRDSRPIIGC
ncbi:Helix-turn-helix [Fulvimarina manganoxydans]|uniref:Helix-turn-helix n=2 Tax=Fulvimarina manganoxydans TaxID=937218 RepID=A0A1W2CR87_9HYPH|nr:Helix-turn-helix [Fulvimarina manganoxydans]